MSHAFSFSLFARKPAFQLYAFRGDAYILIYTGHSAGAFYMAYFSTNDEWKKKRHLRLTASRPSPPRHRSLKSSPSCQGTDGQPQDTGQRAVDAVKTPQSGTRAHAGRSKRRRAPPLQSADCSGGRAQWGVEAIAQRTIPSAELISASPTPRR